MGRDISSLKRQLDKYISDNMPSIEQIKQESPTRVIAEIIESRCPGLGVALTVEICARLGGSQIYLQDSETITRLIRDRWIRESRLDNKILRKVTGLSESGLQRVQAANFDQLVLPGMGGNNDTLRNGGEDKGKDRRL